MKRLEIVYQTKKSPASNHIWGGHRIPHQMGIGLAYKDGITWLETGKWKSSGSYLDNLLTIYNHYIRSSIVLKYKE